MRKILFGAFLALGVALAQDLVIYSGRGEALASPLVEAYQNQSGQKVSVRYGRDAELITALAEEGDRSSADLFWGNSPGALETLRTGGQFRPLPESLFESLAGFYPQDRAWVPLSIRMRVLAYDPTAIEEADLPASVMDLPKHTELKGKVGWTPTYPSFHDFITAMRKLHGEEATREWLLAMQSLEPKGYASNVPLIQGLLAGEISVGLTNHYYIQRFLKSGAEISTHYFTPGDVGNLALVTGAGVLTGAQHPEAAQSFIEFLLSAQAQQFVTGELMEYPVVSGVVQPQSLLPFGELGDRAPELDPSQLNDLEGTLALLRELGIL